MQGTPKTAIPCGSDAEARNKTRPSFPMAVRIPVVDSLLAKTLNNYKGKVIKVRS